MKAFGLVNHRLINPICWAIKLLSSQSLDVDAIHPVTDYSENADFAEKAERITSFLSGLNQRLI
jgi:hypothetical protein